MTNEEYAASLRLLADWYEQHPNIPTPDREFSVYSLNSKEEAADCMMALKPCKKEYKDTMFYLSREFQGITLKFVFYRNAVCTRRVVGTKMVSTQVIPAKTIPEQIIPAHEEEIVEWDCGNPLLASDAPVEIPEDIPS